jgi:chromosome partitioning protein
VRTIAIVNQKGGCGKTTTAINLGAALGRLGRRTLLVDLDPQSHCAAGLGVPEGRVDLDSTEFILRGAPSGGEAFWRAAHNLDLIPSRVRLAALEAPNSPLAGRAAREHALARALSPLAGRFDVCLLDCPPSIGLLTFNALVAADLVLVPVETGYFSLQGASRQLKTVRSVSRRLETQIRCLVVPTLHEPGVSVADDLLAELKRQFGRRLAPVVVHRDTALREAASFGRPVCDHAPHSRAARDYAALASVLIETESLAPGAAEDWTDVDEAPEVATPRPAAPGPNLSDLLYTAPDGSTIASPLPIAHPAALRGQVVVTAAIADLPTPAPRPAHQPAPADTPGPEGRARAEAPPATSRAQDLAQLATRTRAPRPPQPCPTARLRRDGSPRRGGVRPARRARAARRTRRELHRLEASRVPARPPGERPRPAPRPPPGRHEYRLIVDGTWMADPYNIEWTLSEFGEPHSLVEVPAAPASGGEPPHGAD